MGWLPWLSPTIRHSLTHSLSHPPTLRRPLPAQSSSSSSSSSASRNVISFPDKTRSTTTVSERPWDGTGTLPSSTGFNTSQQAWGSQWPQITSLGQGGIRYPSLAHSCGGPRLGMQPAALRLLPWSSIQHCPSPTVPRLPESPSLCTGSVSTIHPVPPSGIHTAEIIPGISHPEPNPSPHS